MKSKIIILLILTNIIFIAIICNFVSKHGNMVKEKQVIKEMTQSENEANLQTQIDALNAVQEEYALSVQAYKKQIAEAITSQGVSTSENDTGAVIATNIGKILSTKTVATATAAQILKGQTAWVNGAQVTGTMVDNGAVNKTLSAGGSYTIPAGYHNGSGKVTVSTLASQTDGTATAAQILKGQTAYVDGKLVTGTMTNNGTVSKTLNAGGSYTIPAGYHSGSGKVTVNSLASQTDGTATAAQILKGQTAYVDGVKVTGTMASNGALNWKPTTSTTKTVAAGYYSGGTLDSSAAYTAGYNAASSANGVKVISLSIDDLGTNWHSSYSYNIGTGKKNVYVVLKNFRTSLSDCNMKLTQSYNSSTGVVTWNYQAESSPDQYDWSLKSCRHVEVDIIYQ